MTATLPALAPVKRMGAPTLYREEYGDIMIAWFEDLASKVQPVADPAPDAKRSVAQVCGQIPTFERFASNIGVTYKALQEWSVRHTSFGEAYARAKSIQADVFAQGLATGVMNPTGAIFVAKNVLGWRDRTEVETVTRAEDSDATLAMKRALEHATPKQLDELRSLVASMLANAPASIEA